MCFYTVDDSSSTCCSDSLSLKEERDGESSGLSLKMIATSK